MSHLGLIGEPIPEQHEEFSGSQGDPFALRAWPPLEAPLRQAFGAQPETLAVVEQEFEGRGGAVSKHKDGTAEGVFIEHLAAHGSQAIDALAEIDWLGGQKDAALWVSCTIRASPKRFSRSAQVEVGRSGF